jgi:hypothetical protein
MTPMTANSSFLFMCMVQNKTGKETCTIYCKYLKNVPIPAPAKQVSLYPHLAALNYKYIGLEKNLPNSERFQTEPFPLSIR